MIHRTLTALLLSLVLAGAARAEIVYRTNGAWGAGKGVALTHAELDGNLWQLTPKTDLASTAAGKGAALVGTATGATVADAVGYVVSTSSTITDHGNAATVGSLKAVSNLIGAAAGTLEAPAATYAVGQALTLGDATAKNLTYRPQRGAIISHGANAVTIHGTIEAGPWQIFSGTGTVTITGPQEKVFPEWWGAKSDGTDAATTTAAINAAFASYSGATTGGVVQLGRGVYKVTTIIGKKGCILRGVGMGEPRIGTRILGSGSGYTIDWLGTEALFFSIEDLSLWDEADTSAGAVRIAASGGVPPAFLSMKNVWVNAYNAVGAVGLLLGDPSHGNFSNVHVHDNRAGPFNAVGLKIYNTTFNTGVLTFDNCSFGTGATYSLKNALIIEEAVGAIDSISFRACYFASQQTLVTTSGDVRAVTWDACHFEGVENGGSIFKVHSLRSSAVRNCQLQGAFVMKYGMELTRAAAEPTQGITFTNNEIVQFKDDPGVTAAVFVAASGATVDSITAGKLKIVGGGVRSLIDTTGAAAGVHEAYYQAGLLNVSAGLTSYALRSGTDQNVWIMPRAGWIRGVYAYTTEDITAQSITFNVQKNYVDTTCSTVLSTSATPKASTFIALGAVSFAAGDTIRITITTPAGFTPVTADVVAVAVVVYQ